MNSNNCTAEENMIPVFSELAIETKGLFSDCEKKRLYEVKNAISHDEIAERIFDDFVNEKIRNMKYRKERRIKTCIYLISCVCIVLLDWMLIDEGLGIEIVLLDILLSVPIKVLTQKFFGKFSVFDKLSYSISRDEKKYLNEAIAKGIKEEILEPIIQGNSIYIEKEGRIRDVTDKAEHGKSDLVSIALKNKIEIRIYCVEENIFQKIGTMLIRNYYLKDEIGLRRWDQYIVISVQEKIYGIYK